MNVVVYRVRLTKDRLVKHLREEHGQSVEKRSTAATLADEHLRTHQVKGAMHIHAGMKP